MRCDHVVRAVPKRARTSSRWYAVGHSTASNRGAMSNHRVHRGFSSESAWNGGSRWIVCTVCTIRTASSPQPAMSSPSCLDSQMTTMGRSFSARSRSARAVSHARYSAPNPSITPTASPAASRITIGAVVRCQSGSMTTGSSTAPPATLRYSSAGSASPACAASRSHPAAPPSASTASSNRLRKIPDAEAAPRSTKVARCAEWASASPGSTVSSSGSAPASAICRARASVAIVYPPSRSGISRLDRMRYHASGKSPEVTPPSSPTRRAPRGMPEPRSPRRAHRVAGGGPGAPPMQLPTRRGAERGPGAPDEAPGPPVNVVWGDPVIRGVFLSRRTRNPAPIPTARAGGARTSPRTRGEVARPPESIGVGAPPYLRVRQSAAGADGEGAPSSGRSG